MGETWRPQRPPGSEETYRKMKMQEEIIFRKLKEMGCRITKQRKLLLNIILQEECASCKEIYYKARKEDGGIGAATVYRMINLLEEIGAISRKNMYTIPGPAAAKGVDNCSKGHRISLCMKPGEEIACVVELDDGSVCCLSAGEWHQVMEKGLSAWGYITSQKIANIYLSPCLDPEEQLS